MSINKKNTVINDLLITYYENDVESETKIIFLHGWRSESQVWFNLINSMPEYKCYAIDLPGFGGSEAPKSDWTSIDYANLVREFIHRMNLQKPMLVGHSNGGRTIIRLVSVDSEIAGKIVLVDASGLKKSTSQTSAMSTIAKLVKPFFAPSFMQPLRKKIYKSIGSEDYVSTPQLKGTYLNLIKEDLTEELPKIINPTLIVWGENDNDTPVEAASIMEDKIPNSALKIIPDAGHYCFLDSPEEFKNILIDFIKS